MIIVDARRIKIFVKIFLICFLNLWLTPPDVWSQPVISTSKITMTDEAYTLKPGDKLKITVFNEKELTGEYEVDEFGRITFPIIGEVGVAGMKVGDAKARIVGLLSEYVRNPQMSISQLFDKSAYVSILGEITNPGYYELEPNMTILTLIAKSGALRETANTQDIRILRTKAEGDQQIISVSVDDIFRGKVKDVPLFSGDIINIPKRVQFQDEVYVTILGEIKKPGTYTHLPGMTLMQIIAIAGDFSDKASGRTVQIIRMLPDGKKETVKVDVTKILKGDEPDMVVSPGDIVSVPRSFEEGYVTVVGHVRKPGRYEYRDGITLLSAIAESGDIQETANPKKIKIIRNDEGERIIFLVNMYDILKGQLQDVDLKPGDVVAVPEAFF